MYFYPSGSDGLKHQRQGPHDSSHSPWAMAILRIVVWIIITVAPNSVVCSVLVVVVQYYEVHHVNAVKLYEL
jgi:hypothetical protein